MRKITFLKLLTVMLCFMVFGSCTKTTQIQQDRPFLAITEEMVDPEYVDGVEVFYQGHSIGYCIAAKGRVCYLPITEDLGFIADEGYAYKPKNHL